jgi:hypothetical protein
MVNTPFSAFRPNDMLKNAQGEEYFPQGITQVGD